MDREKVIAIANEIHGTEAEALLMNPQADIKGVCSAIDTLDRLGLETEHGITDLGIAVREYARITWLIDALKSN